MLATIRKRIGHSLARMMSIHDPRWGQKPEGDYKANDGRKPNEGPPDLDQMWRDFNNRLNRMFGQRGDGNNGGGPRPDGRGAGGPAGLVAGVAFLIWLASGAFTVHESQQAVVTTFGAVDHIAGAGFNWRWPKPIQSHELVDVSQNRSAEIGYRGNPASKNLRESLMLTQDQNIVDIQFAVQYNIKDAVQWLYSNRDPAETVHQIAETAIREVVGNSKMDFVLYEGREKVANDVQKLMQTIADRYKLGALITNVTMQGVQPPEQVQSSFDDAVKAGQDKERLKSEGQAYAQDVIPRASGTASRLNEEARAYREMVIANATGNAARFDQVAAEYAKAPGVTRDRMYLDTMQQIFTSTSKVMVDAKSGSQLLYLPLDKLIAQTAANSAAVGAKSGPVQEAQPATPTAMQSLEQVRQRDNRSRESSRDREIR